MKPKYDPLHGALMCVAMIALACFASLCIKYGELADTLRTTIPATLNGTRTDLNKQASDAVKVVQDGVTAAQTEIQQTRTDALAEIDKQLVPEMDALNNNAATVGASIAGSVDQHLGNVEAHLNDALDGATATLADTDKTVKDLHPQMLGLVAASKVLAGESAQTMRTVRDATPQLVDQAKQMGAQGQAIAEDSHKIADDASRYVAAFTKPMSKKQEAFHILVLVGIGALHFF